MHHSKPMDAWRVDDIVDIGVLQGLRICAALYDHRCTTFSLIAGDGTTYRYYTGQTEPTKTGQKTPPSKYIVDLELPRFH